MTASEGPAEFPVPSLALVVLDGWGLAPPGPGNAVSQASTPVFDELWERYPHTTLSASGRDVGLPDGQMGNSEVGHLNLGAGSIVAAGPDADQRRDRRRQLLREPGAEGRLRGGSLEPPRAPAPDGPRLRRRRPLRLGAHRGVRRAGRRARACPTSSCTRSPMAATRCRTSGAGYVRELERWLRHAGRIGTVSGRYYAMDRDRRWERTQARLRRDRGRSGPRAPSAARGHRATPTGAARPTSSCGRP